MEADISTHCTDFFLNYLKGQNLCKRQCSLLTFLLWEEKQNVWEWNGSGGAKTGSLYQY